jgi:hypothetical protein
VTKVPPAHDCLTVLFVSCFNARFSSAKVLISRDKETGLMISAADNSADDARQLAVLFAGVAQDVDEYRSSHLRELTPKVRAQLEDALQQLDDANDNLASGAARKTLRAIEEDLDEISAVATQARQALKKVKNSSSVANVAASIAALALAIASADAGSIPAALEDVSEALKLQQNSSSAADED